MATWRQYDKLESMDSTAGAAVAEFCSTLIVMSPELEPQRQRVIEAARALRDATRDARHDAEAIVVHERGYRR